MEAGASVDHGVEVEATEDHGNRAADRGCCASACGAENLLRLGMSERIVLISNNHCSFWKQITSSYISLKNDSLIRE